MAGSNPSGRRSRRHPSDRPDSSLQPKRSRRKRRGPQARSTKRLMPSSESGFPSQTSAPRQQRRPRKPITPSNVTQSGRPKTRRVRPTSFDAGTAAGYEQSYPHVDSVTRFNGNDVQRSSFDGTGLNGDGSNGFATVEYPYPTGRQSPNPSQQMMRPSMDLARPDQPQQNVPQASHRPSREIRLGPDMRRRPQLSSNPAFIPSRMNPQVGQNRGPGPSSSYGQQVSYPDSAYGQRQTVQFPPNQSLGSSPSGPGSSVPGSIEARRLPGTSEGAGALGLAPQRSVQPRVKNLQPRPVPRRSGSRRLRSRQLSRVTTAPKSRALPANLEQSQSKSVSPFIYAIRLLILGVGVGAIAGTLISAIDPSRVPGQQPLDQSINSSGDRIQQDGQISEPATDNTGVEATSPSIPLNRGIGSFSNVVSLDAIPKRTRYTTLEKQLQTMADNQLELTPGIFALDLDTYNYVDLNGGSIFSAASIIKVPILVAFLQDVEQNKISLDEILTMEEGDVAGGSGNMQLGTIGDTYSAIETAKKMIVISDNTATNMLIRRMGGINQLNQRFRSWGLTATALRNPLPDLEGTNTTSPSEMTHLMTLISQGKLLNLRSRDRMLDIMYKTETATLLPAGIGGNAAIAHKTGDIGAMVGDTGLVDTPSGKRYAITIMMRRPHNDNRAQELIRQMVGVIHREFQTPSTPLNPSVLPDQSPSSTGTTHSSENISEQDEADTDAASTETSE